MKVEQRCLQCDNKFYISSYYAKMGRKFCCKKCYTEYRKVHDVFKEILNTTCVVCAKEFHIQNWQKRKQGNCCSIKCSSIKQTKKQNIRCNFCQKVFSIHKSSIKKKNFCSKKCFYKSKRKQIICEWCNKKVVVRKSLKNGKHCFCSNRCKFKWYKGKPKERTSKTLSHLISIGKVFTKNRGFKNGFYISTITKKQERYDSSYELKRMIQLDKLGLQWTKKHGIRIPYLDENNHSHNYVPDFFIENRIIEEVKPKSYLNNKITILKFKAAYEYCKQHNLIFKIITEKELGIK